MLKFVVALAVAAMATSAMAQTGPSAGPWKILAQNSGAGVAGQPGSKNGPAARSPSGTTGTATGQGSSQAPANDVSHPQDASKVPGLPGNKSGPAVTPRAGSNGQ